MANPEDLGRYRLKRLLGRGALGEVWEASDLEQQGSKVAVKIMHAADDELALARAQFAREARLASLVRHPNMVQVHDAGEAAGTSFLVMDMVEGTSLRAVIRDGTATVADKLRWLHQIADALTALHHGGVAHRDLKPENVIIRPDRTACVVDLGIAKWIRFDLGGELDPEDPFEPPVDRARPTSEYVPPETTDQEVYDELGDQFAFGVLAYELLTGSPPKDGSPPLTERDDLPRGVAVALDRARSTSRDERWDAMELLVDELGATSGGAPEDPPDGAGAASADGADAAAKGKGPEAAGAEERPSRLSPVVIGAVAVVLVLAALAAVLR